jgi:hypothetical protein
MATLILSGNRGLQDIDVSGYNLSDARQLTCNVWQGVKNTGVNIDPSSPANAEFLGGRILGINDNKPLPWRPPLRPGEWGRHPDELAKDGVAP